MEASTTSLLPASQLDAESFSPAIIARQGTSPAENCNPDEVVAELFN